MECCDIWVGDERTCVAALPAIEFEDAEVNLENSFSNTAHNLDYRA
jgi:hypothetical protein